MNTFNIDLGTPAFYEFPINKLVGNMYLKRELPLWNPYQGIGTPLAAQYSTRAFFPFQILEDISPYWLWDYFMLARLVIAAFFTYLFLRLLGVSSPCAFLGGIFYGLCGSFTWFINLEQFANVAMMVPICLFSTERLLLYGKGRHSAELAIVLALMLLAGQPEIAVYVMLLVGVYYWFRVMIKKQPILVSTKEPLSNGKFVAAERSSACPDVTSGGSRAIAKLALCSYQVIAKLVLCSYKAIAKLVPCSYRIIAKLALCSYKVIAKLVPCSCQPCRKPAFSVEIILDFLKFGAIVLLPLGLSAFLILPFLEFIPNSYQCHPLGGTMGVQDPTPLTIAIGILIPSFFELPTYYRLFPHNGAWDCLGGYTGILMIFLIVLGFFCPVGRVSSDKKKFGKAHQISDNYCMDRHRKFFLFFSLFGLFIVLKNFGLPLASWIGRLPLLNQSWSPRWAGPVWTFSLACAAAIALEMASKVVYKKSVIFGALFFLLCLIGFFSYKTTYFQQFKNLNIEGLKSALPPILGGVIISVYIIFIAAVIFIYHRSRKDFVRAHITSNGWVYSIIFLAILELWFYIPKGANFPWTVFKFSPFLLGIPIVYFLANEKWRLSIIGIILVILFYAFIDVRSPCGFPNRQNLFKEPDYATFFKKDKSFSRIVAGDGILMPNFSSAFGIYDIRYINSLSPVYYQNYVDEHLLKTPHSWITDRLWFTGISDFNKLEQRPIYQEISDSLPYYSYLGVRYILTPKSVTLSLPVVYDKDIKIYKNPYAVPRAYVAQEIKMAASFKEAQELIGAKDMEVRNTVIVEEAPPCWYKPSSSDSGSETWIEEYTPNKIKIRASMQSDGILVLTDVFYPGWKAYVKPITEAHSFTAREDKIYRVNGIVRGVFLRAGDYDVTFRYEPGSFKIGVVLSSITALLCVVLCQINKGMISQIKN